ncbi:MAG: flagellar motor protein MotB [Pseudomonadota bacterium]
MPKKKAPVGAPAWMVTFADLMSLLVCFFVLIISFSIQDTVKLQVVAGSMRDAFGVQSEKRLAGIIELDGVPERQQARNVQLIDDPIAVEEEYAQQNDGQESGSKPAGDDKLSSSAIEQARFNRVKAKLENALAGDPALSAMSDQVTIQLTEEGLSVVMVDNQGRSMFERGSAVPNDRAKRLIAAIGESVADLPNRILVEGHTDGEAISQGGGYSRFELTAERANAARRILQMNGVQEDQIAGVTGVATTMAEAPIR